MAGTLTNFKGYPRTIKQAEHTYWASVYVSISFAPAIGVLKCIFTVLAPPISIFGSQAQDPINVEDDVPIRTMSSAQMVNNARRRSFSRIADQDEADPTIKYKKAKSGSTKNVKVVAPRGYPVVPVQQRGSGGSQAGSSQPNPSEQVQISVLCLPRTVRPYHFARSSRDLAN